MIEREIFIAAVQKERVTERAAYLQAACGVDAALRERVEGLLAVHDNAANFLERPAVAMDSDGTAGWESARSAEGPGTVIGPYKLLEQIGDGGMGVVYVAEQTRPMRRKMALKIIKPGMDTKQVVARFEAERQALAMMITPNIARVHDGGATESGRPYFVMELVRGIPITDYCDREQLSITDRLDLFVLVCRAVQHAHQKGVIHRDLKPSNILVTVIDGVAVPKVIDFGVAKAMGQQLTEKTLFTGFAQLVGTPLYMSPEQADPAGVDIDTRSDIYSLGVLLYELLTGTTPFDQETLRKAGFDEVRRIIREEDPPKPSTRLSGLGTTLTTLSANRKTDTRRLHRLVRGELDWIVMKALEKDRRRRYETANDFAADVMRYLTDQPVEACAPSPAYRLRKFVWRNRVWVSIVVLVAAMVFLGGSFSWLAYQGELRRADLAEKLRRADDEQRREKWARDITLPQIERLIVEEHPVAAFRVAKAAKEALPEDPRLKALWGQLTEVATIQIEPSGTRVFIRDWDARDDDWLEVGGTPLASVRLPRGELRWKLVKEGYVTLEMQRAFPDLGAATFSLAKESDAPPGMVAISPATAKASPGPDVDIGRFFIDRFEVTSRDYQQFVDAGGYQKPQYWQHEFRQAGKVIPRDAAMAVFRDQTGIPGPSTWSDGHFPVGEDEFPVRGVSWYEAAAFAVFRGKSLPTVHHWWWAAHGNLDLIVRLSNFSYRGPAPAGDHPGIGSFGVYDMAGNVTEWCSNEGNGDKRTLRGGAWSDPLYMFEDVNADAPMARASTYGFRCVRYLDEPSAEALAPYRPKYHSVPAATAEELAAHLTHFAYDRDMPLNAETRAIDCEPAAEYRHDIVRIDAAYAPQKFNIHMYFPRNVSPPYETIVWFPGASATRMDRLAIDSTAIDPHDKQYNKTYYVDQDGRCIRGLLRTGRATCVPIYVGTFERRGVEEGRHGSIRQRAFCTQEAKDLSRTIDYLQTRADIDSKRLIYVGYSRGARLAPVLLVVEPRFRAAVLIAGGYRPALAMPEVESRRYAPHVKLPILMINGLNDEVFPVESSQMPMFNQLGSADKQIKHIKHSGRNGHVLPIDETLKFADDWLRSRTGADSR